LLNADHATYEFFKTFIRRDSPLLKELKKIY
jgi:hypothetical protein